MPAPLQILLAWGLFLPALCGLGFLVARALPRPREPIDLSLGFWLGAAALGAAALAWHLFLPIDGRIWIALGPAAAAGLFLERGSLRARWTLALCMLAFAAWLATRATLASACPDDHLYYTQTVRWHSAYAAVPGLGNLHPFLAFNNAYHAVVAALGVGPLSLRGDHVANGLFLIAVVAACTKGLFNLIRGPASAADALAALLLGPALDFSLADQLTCPAADFAVHMAGTGLLLAALEPVLGGKAMGPRRASAVAAACAGAVILKQSMICIALPMALFALVQSEQRWRALRGAALASLAIAVPWLAHGTVLSGYPIFPSAWPDLGVTWRMDPEVVRSSYRWIHAYARWAGHPDADVIASSAWVGRWFEREWLNNRTFLLPALGAIAGAVGLAAARLAGRSLPRAVLAALAPVVLGVALWWLLAPDTRFAGPLLWAVADLLCLAALLSWRPALDANARFAIAACALAVAAGAFVGWHPSLPWNREFPPLRHNQRTRTVSLPGGGTVEASGPAGCWDLPCGWPPFDPRLRFRRPGDLASGFTLQPGPTQ